MEIRNPSILIVDDDRYIVDLVMEFLAGLSMECIGFTDPREALSSLEKRTFDLVLTDLRMGQVSGMDILRAARDPDPADGTDFEQTIEKKLGIPSRVFFRVEELDELPGESTVSQL